MSPWPLIAAHQVYDDQKYLTALEKLGDFLLLAQMPDPQPGWAQQYSYDMKPIWARNFEPPGVSGDETQERTRNPDADRPNDRADRKYLDPIPRRFGLAQTLSAFRRPPRPLLRIQTNRPLYMTRRGASILADLRRLEPTVSLRLENGVAIGTAWQAIRAIARQQLPAAAANIPTAGTNGSPSNRIA